MSNEANVAPTKVVPVATTVSPYYDDFTENKNFHRILFRPGYAVQARELTQLQTIMQTQVERFGNHIFKNGSLVLGGTMTIDDRAQHINLQSTYAGSDVVATNFKANTITLESGNVQVRAYVSGTAEATATEPPTLVLKYLSGEEFSNGATLKTNTEIYANVSTSANYTGPATLVSINDGIFYINGYFVKVPAQTIVADKYSDKASVRIGLEYSEDIVTEQQDATLLDPAQESSNYQAPGAARLKVNFDLVTRALDSVDDEQFVELMRVEGGIIKKQVVYPIYSVLGDTLARRTYDESGDYTVRRFAIALDDHPTDNTKLQIVVDPGKAYVKGYEYESISQQKIDLNRARETRAVEGRDITINFGNYIFFNDINGSFDASALQNVSFYTTNSGVAPNQNNKIATARIREIKHSSVTNPNDAGTSTLKISFFDINVTNTQLSITQANSIFSSTASANVAPSSKSGGHTVIRDTNYNLLVFPTNEAFIQAGSLTNQDFQFQRQTTSSFGGSFSLVLTLQPNETFAASGGISGTSDIAYENFIAFNPSGERINLVSVSISSSNPQTATVTSNNYVGAATILYRVNTPTDVPQRSKIARTANTTHFLGSILDATITNGTRSTSVYSANAQVVITNPSNVPNEKMSLYIPDVTEITAIYDLNGTSPTLGASLENCIDVTSNYNLDTGQRDSHYDHASISLSSRAQPSKGPLVVCLNYYSHSASETGYFSLDSYPNASGNGYTQIPSYTTLSGQSINLRDAIDFRPTKQIASTGENYTLIGQKIPYSGTAFEADYSYYLGRRAHLTLTTDTTNPFKVEYGESAVAPTEPRIKSDAMVLYKFNLEPYTGFKNNVSTFFVENRRYTMRDIGKLEQRIENLEYYQTLSILEKNTKDLSILDENGLERTKYGILADNFTTHGYGDVYSPDYLISIDKVYGAMRPAQNAASIPMITNVDMVYLAVIDPEGSSPANPPYEYDKVTRKKNNILLNYTEQTIIDQPAATKWISVQPYMMAQWVGQIEMNPPDDVWTETRQAPDIIVNNFFENDALGAIGGLRLGWINQWGPWGWWDNLRWRRGWFFRGLNPWITESFWWANNFGSPFREEGVQNQQIGPTQFSTEVTSTTERIGRRTLATTTTLRETETRMFDNGIVDVSIIPFIRQQLIQFRASGLRPNRKVWFFFDDQDVTNYIIDTTEALDAGNNDTVVINDGFSNNDFLVKSSNNFIRAWPLFSGRWWYPWDLGFRISRKRFYKLMGLWWPIFVGDTLIGTVTGNTATIGAITVKGGETLERWFESRGANTVKLPPYTSAVANNYWGVNGANSIWLIPRSWRRGRPLRAYIGDGTNGFDNVSRLLYLSNTFNNLITIGGDRFPDQDANTIDGNTISWTITGNNYLDGSGWFTDREGNIDGIFAVPAETFRTGERTFRIIDVPSNDTDDCTTRADFRFVSSGIRQTRQRTIVNNIRTTTFVQTRRIDPIAQTFFIEAEDNPNGTFISSVEIYFRSKSEGIPVRVEIRPTVNGYPSSDKIIEGAEATLNSEYVNLSEDGTVPTKFTFSAPVHLVPGEYAIVVLSSTFEYEVFVSELGQRLIGSTRTVGEQPYIGSFFKSQNASTWDASQLEDLKFKLNRCVFEPQGTVVFYNVAPSVNAIADIVYTHVDDTVLSNTDILYSHSIDYGTTYQAYSPDTNQVLNGRTTFTADASSFYKYRLKAVMRTQDPLVSPVIDASTLQLISAENYIDNASLENSDIIVTNSGFGYASNSNIAIRINSSYGSGANGYATTNTTGSVVSITLDNGGSGYIESANVVFLSSNATTVNATAVISGENSSAGGPALAKYISRVVNLAEGFDAADIRLFLTAYKPSGTDLKVYYKVRNVNDTEPLDDKNWTLMRQQTGSTIYSPTKNYDAALEFEFRPMSEPEPIVYTNNAGTATYDTFNQFAIKIVLLSSDTTNYPIVYDMRAIALPGLA